MARQVNKGRIDRDSRAANRSSGVGALSDQIRDAIVSGELGYEEPLTQAGLAERFGVSRTPLREVLRVLELEGLVDRESNGRFRIAPLSLDDIEELSVIRIGLETAAIRLTVPTLDNIDHAELEGLLAQIDRLILLEDWDGFDRPHREFHARISAGIGPRMNELLDRLWNQAARYRRASTRVAASGTEVRREEHRGLLDAVEAYDAERAAGFMALQIARTAIELARDIDPGRKLENVRTLLAVHAGRAGIRINT